MGEFIKSKKLIIMTGGLAIFVIALVSIILFTGGSERDSHKIRSMSNQKIVNEYESLLSDYQKSCNAIASKYSTNELSDTYAVSGNTNWWTMIDSTAKDLHTPIYYSTDGAYGIEGKLGKSTYFVTGMMFFFGDANGSEIYESGIQENILNALLGTKDFNDMKLTVFVNDTYRINLRKYLNDNGLGENIEIVSGRNTDLSEVDYDLFMASNPTEEQVLDASSKGIPMYVSYNRNWDYDSYTNELFNITIINDTPKALKTTGSCENSFYSDMEDTYTLLDTLVNGKLELTMSDTWSCEKAKETQCDFANVFVKNSDATSILDYYYEPVNKLRNIIKEYDKQSIDIFSLNYGYDVKLALAIAENFREEVVYGKDLLDYTAITEHTQFYKTMFADTIINYAADDNELSNSLGRYSPNEDKIQKLKTHNETVNIDKLISGKVTSTGVYVKAGQTTTITRKDDSEYDLTLYINYQNDEASQIYDNNDNMGYDRPYTDRSNAILIESGKTYTISTPKGGSLFFKNDSGVDIDNIVIEAKNVLNNPYLDKFDDESINEFAIEVATTPFGFVDIVTPYVQLHSSTSNMITAIGNYGGETKLFVYDILTYWGEVNYSYGGYIVDGTPNRSTNVNQFFSDMDLTEYANDASIHDRGPQQTYSDRATCGWMCAGYDITDQYSGFNPLGWGENHELGHQMQNSYTKIYADASSEVSNNIYPMEVLRQYAIENGEEYYMGNRSGYNNQSAYAAVVTDYGNAMPSNYLWTDGNGNDRLAVYQQIKYASGDEEFYTKLNILARILGANYYGDDFLAVKDKIGLSTYDENYTMSGGDFMAIMGSLIADRDLTGFFEGLGIYVSPAAKAQIIANGSYSKAKIDGMFYFVPGKDGDYGYIPVNYINNPNIDSYLISISGNNWYDPTL